MSLDEGGKVGNPSEIGQALPKRKSSPVSNRLRKYNLLEKGYGCADDKRKAAHSETDDRSTGDPSQAPQATRRKHQKYSSKWKDRPNLRGPGNSEKDSTPPKTAGRAGNFVSVPSRTQARPACQDQEGLEKNGLRGPNGSLRERHYRSGDDDLKSCPAPHQNTNEYHIRDRHEINEHTCNLHGNGGPCHIRESGERGQPYGDHRRLDKSKIAVCDYPMDKLNGTSEIDAIVVLVDCRDSGRAGMTEEPELPPRGGRL